ncbi:MAG TPA: hypothetical protein VF375_04485 [Candidatus Limnocylindrales bacterium]
MNDAIGPRTDRTRIRRHADRAVPDRIEEFLQAGPHGPGDYTTATDDDLRGVEVTDITIDEASAKMREGGSMHPEDDDPNYPGSASIRPVR